MSFCLYTCVCFLNISDNMKFDIFYLSQQTESSLRGELGEAKSRITRCTEEIKQLQAQISEMKILVDRLTRENNDKQSNIVRLSSQIKTMESKWHCLVKDLDEVRGAYEKLIKVGALHTLCVFHAFTIFCIQFHETQTYFLFHKFSQKKSQPHDSCRPMMGAFIGGLIGVWKGKITFIAKTNIFSLNPSFSQR